VLVGRVVGNKVQDHLEAPVLHAGQQFLEERQVPVLKKTVAELEPILRS
jgi:hypothetical protein